MQRYFIELSYKGTNYHGWQIQPNAPTVQDEINKALSVILKSTIDCTGCGRTDTGVHAKKYIAHFDTKQGIPDEAHFLYQLNSIVPEDISIYKLYKTNNEANARYSAKSRIYKYFIHTQKDPFLIETSYLFKPALNLDLMNYACSVLLKHSDFTSFSKLHSDNKTNICKISAANWEEENNQIIFTITADRFLRGMVRAIVGTMIEIGLEKISINKFEEIILTKDRALAGTSAPAHGLFLWEVVY